MQAYRWSWLPLIACAAAGVAAQTPADTTDEQEVEREESNWVLPPLRATGSLSYDFRGSRGSGSDASAHLVTANVALQTFVYAPWLATVSAEIGASSGWSRQKSAVFLFNDGLSDTISQDSRTRDRFVTGTLRATLFPASRFPFEAHITRADSRNDSGLGMVLGFRTQNIGLSQQYQPEGGAYRVWGRYDHNEQTAMGLRSKQDLLSADFSTGWKNNNIGLGGSHSRARDVGTDNDTRFDTLVLRHDYSPGRALSVNSTVNWTRARDLSEASRGDLQLLQWSSVGIWQQESTGLSLTGSARATALRESVRGNSLDSVGATLGANYTFNPKLRLTANVGVNTTRSDASDSTSLSGSTGASYQGDTYTFAGATYQWFAGASLGGSVGTGSDTETDRHGDLNLQLGHSISRPLSLLGQEVSLSATQSLGWSRGWSTRAVEDGSGANGARQLLSSVSATWQKPGDEGNLYVRTMYSDAMTLGEANQRFQMFNFQVSGGLRLDNQRSFTGDLTYQQTWQRGNTVGHTLDAASERIGRSSVGGEISYRHNNLFGVPRLHFSTRIRLAQDVLRQPGSLLSLPDRETRLWESRLTWNVGRLDADLNLRLSQIDGHNVRSFLFRVQRSFSQ
jgi:hypothetical protein